MALRYTMAGAVASAAAQVEMNDGIAVIELDELNEASFVSLYKDQQLRDRQHLLRYRKRGDSVRLASDAYFFEEGSGQEYRAARFGEIRINTVIHLDGRYSAGGTMDIIKSYGRSC